MINTKKLNLGTFVYQSENVDGVEVQSYLGIPYAKAAHFGMPTVIDEYKNDPVNSGIGLRFPQNYVPTILYLFLKNPMMRKEILTQGDKTDENAFVLNIWTSSTEGKNPYSFLSMAAVLHTVRERHRFTTENILHQKGLSL